MQLTEEVKDQVGSVQDRAKSIQSLELILGDVVAVRLKQLCETTQGWDGTDAKPLSSASLATARAFFEQIGRPAPITGLFLSYDGELIASWTTGTGTDVDASFYSDYVHLRTERFEGSVALNEPEFARRAVEAIS